MTLTDMVGFSFSMGSEHTKAGLSSWRKVVHVSKSVNL